MPRARSTQRAALIESQQQQEGAQATRSDGLDCLEPRASLESAVPVVGILRCRRAAAGAEHSRRKPPNLDENERPGGQPVVTA